MYDAHTACCTHVLRKHSDKLYTVSFSPDGRLVATGSADRTVRLWSLQDGSVVRSFAGKGAVFDVCWREEGDKLAASFSNGDVVVVDVRV